MGTQRCHKGNRFTSHGLAIRYVTIATEALAQLSLQRNHQRLDADLLVYAVYLYNGMGKKGKGRQSGGFASKSLRANHHQDISRLRDETLQWTRRETAGFVAWSNAHQKQQRRLMGERPRFALALRRNLNGILDERRALRVMALATLDTRS